jgi:hypothetical protein
MIGSAANITVPDDATLPVAMERDHSTNPMETPNGNSISAKSNSIEPAEKPRR